MSLIYSEIIHFIVSTLIGYIFYRYFCRSYWIFVVALLGGFFIDIDHLVDFWIADPFSLDIGGFFAGINFEKTQKAYLIFHGWEYILIFLILIFFIKNRFKYYISVFVLSVFFHLIIDVFTNETSFGGYSIIYRAFNNFELQAIGSRK